MFHFENYVFNKKTHVFFNGRFGFTRAPPSLTLRALLSGFNAVAIIITVFFSQNKVSPSDFAVSSEKFVRTLESNGDIWENGWRIPISLEFFRGPGQKDPT